MVKETKYIKINYTDKDRDYIDCLLEFIKKSEEEIVNFFDIKYFGEKVTLNLYDDLDNFRKNISIRCKNNVVPDWLCGFSYLENNKFIINTLCLEEYKKTKGHENNNLDDLKYLIMHEFVHSCQQKYTNSVVSSSKAPIWLKEGMAIFISHQYDNTKLSFNATSEEIIDGNTSYSNYYSMFSYVYNSYGKEYILELLKNSTRLINDTPTLFEETKKYYSGCVKG